MNIVVNGERREIADDLTVADFLLATAGTVRGSAVVVDGEVVPRSEWSRRRFEDGQSIELITAAQGG